MDEASKLVSDLQDKLAELDHKVWQYRREMAAEFTKYAEDILHNAPQGTSETVLKAIASDIKKYESLSLDAAGWTESFQTGNSEGSERTVPSYFTNTTNPNSFDRSEGDIEIPRSPHEREKEFRGIFTPPYLPLLDSESKNERRSSREQLSPAINNGKQKEVERMSGHSSPDIRPLTPSPELRRIPPPRRRNTDEVSLVSVASDHSETPGRRSALRRLSSNSAKAQSPRRVRFDVEGSEVLPSSSPRPSESISTTDIPSEVRLLSDYSDDEGGSEQVEDIESPLVPKRVSSSQALRALSSQPYDDHTEWTTLSAPPDGSASIAGLSSTEDGSDDEKLEISNGKQTSTPGSSSKSISIPTQTAHQPSEADIDDDEVETVSDDEENFGIAPLKRTSKSESATILSPIDGPNIDEDKTPTSATRSPSKSAFELEPTSYSSGDKGIQDTNFDDDDDDELFPFDENIQTRGLPDSTHDESDSEDPPSPIVEIEDEKESSKAQPIQQSISPPIMLPIYDTPKPPVKPVNGIVGSYKGRTFGFPVASDEVQARVANVNVNSFVGSLNGNSGMDESDVRSFRESFRNGLGSFTGAPKTMSERMMMEDLLEAEQTAQP